MSKSVICPDCRSYEHCTQMGWSDASKCANFNKRDDALDDLGLFVDKSEVSDNDVYIDTPLFIPHDSVWAVGKLDTADLMSNTMEIVGCERIIFKDKTLDFQFEIGHDQYKDINTIIINGIKFVRG